MFGKQRCKLWWILWVDVWEYGLGFQEVESHVASSVNNDLENLGKLSDIAAVATFNWEGFLEILVASENDETRKWKNKKRCFHFHSSR